MGEASCCFLVGGVGGSDCHLEGSPNLELEIFFWLCPLPQGPPGPTGVRGPVGHPGSPVSAPGFVTISWIPGGNGQCPPP